MSGFTTLATEFLDTYGLAAIFVIMLCKEAGIPIPIPGDIIMLGAAARAAEGTYDVLHVIVAFEAAALLGATTQFLVARGPGRQIIYRFGRYLGLTADRLNRATAAVQKGGIMAVGLGLMTPGVRIATVAASGLAGLPLRTFLPGLVIGSSAFFAAHLVLGYAGGPLVQAALGAVNLPVLLFVALVLALGLAGWLIRSRWMRGQRAGAAAALAWSEAGCPACTAVGLLRRRGPEEA